LVKIAQVALVQTDRHGLLASLVFPGMVCLAEIAATRNLCQDVEPCEQLHSEVRISSASSNHREASS
jgi:hypothetical protein